MVALLVACTYLLLAGVHVYWALGGRLAKDAAVPRVPRKVAASDIAPPATASATVPAFTPSRTGTLLVAVGLEEGSHLRLGPIGHGGEAASVRYFHVLREELLLDVADLLHRRHRS